MSARRTFSITNTMSTAPSVLREQMRTLYNGHHGWLYAWIRLEARLLPERRRSGARHILARLLASRGVPADLREPRAFLTSVAKGLMSNSRKRRALEEAYLAGLAGMPVATVPPPEQRVLVLEALHEIDMMLDELAPKSGARSCSRRYGLKYCEIAREMHVSEITVKRYMRQAFLHCLTRLDGTAAMP